MENKHFCDLESELTNIEIELAENPTNIMYLRYEELRAELRQFENRRIKGDIIRSKVKWAEEGERSSKFFLGLEKQNSVKKHMRKINVCGTIVTDPYKIQVEQKDFYSKLYKSTQSADFVIPDTFFRSDDISTLTENEKRECDRDITAEECEKVLLTFKNDKSPGNDGLTYEFYKTFWTFIYKPLIDCYEYAYIHNELSTSQKQGIITLLEKTGKDRMNLKNWRPISLLNFDYKLLTKLLSVRVQKYLPGLIHPNQAGFVKGRFIGDAIRIIQDLIEYTDKKNLPGILLFIDFEKAFDTIEWNFIWKVFKRFNFGDSFIRWLKIMYTNPSSCIINNGISGQYFQLGRGVRQGDPLSPYVFILAIELLAIKIRSHPDIVGIRIKNNEFKLSLYADDMTVAVQDTNSATKVFDIIQTFSSHSGLKVNTTKTEGMWLGSDKYNKHKPFGIKWPQTPIKVLGIYHSHDKESAIKLNFNDKIESLLKQLHWWKARNLSLTGKILIIKALALSKFSLLASLMCVPKDIISKVNSAIYHFIWNGKTDKVKRILLEQDFENGGLRMLDFGTMIKGAKIKWITRYLSGERADWKLTFEIFCGKENLNIFLRSNFDIEEISAFVPSYYVESIKWWSMIKLKENLNYEQFIWYNKRIKNLEHVVYSPVDFLPWAYGKLVIFSIMILLYPLQFS